jgi:ubiquinone/menaquinone biosynthesis C-methylase UbiE
MGYVGVPFFNIGSGESMDRLAEMCRIGVGTRVLEVGCGTGTNACLLAEKYGCTVVGVDIAEYMVAQARRRAEELRLTDRVTFMVGDAYSLDFPDASFDVVVTVFVSQFLNPTRAFPGFLRILCLGGCLGVNEMYRDDDVPADAKKKVDDAEKLFHYLTELPFTLRSPKVWLRAFEEAGFGNVAIEVHSNAESPPYSGDMVEVFGGWGKLLGILWSILVFAIMSGVMRRRFSQINEVKKRLLRDKVTRKYIGYVLSVGKK